MTDVAPITEIIEEIRAGRMVVLVDEEDRENEGDLVFAAEFATPEMINFMAKHARGLICLTLTQAHCKQLDLPLMVRENGLPLATNFTLSIEAATGVTTGISAADRARTVLAAANKNAKPSDIVQPGHIFPLMARDGGVLVRAAMRMASRIESSISPMCKVRLGWPQCLKLVTTGLPLPVCAPCTIQRCAAV